MKIVISLGGSLLTRDLTARNFKRYSEVVHDLKRQGHKLIVVCGGGKVCRDYRDVVKALGGDKDQQDFVGIMATHINAATFSAAVKGSHLVKWKSLKEAVKEVKKNFGRKVIVAAGYDLGTSSDFDAAVFADEMKAGLLINVSNVDGIYTADPKKDPHARKIDNLSYDEFDKIIRQNEQTPGEYRLFDLAAVRLIKKSKIRVIFVGGSDPKEIERAVEGNHHGSVVG